MRLSNAASLLFSVVAFGAVSSCGPDSKVTSAPPSREVVAVAAATRENLSRELVLTGEFRPFQEVEVMAKVAGYLKKIYVDVGDRVKEGQLLAVLEIPELGDDMRRAGASVDRSDAEVTRARDEVKRAESSHTMVHLTYQRLSDVAKQRPGLIAQQEIDDAQSKDLAAEAGVAAAQSNLNAAMQQVSVNKADQSHADTMNRYTQVTAPFAGVVTKRYADTGALIQAGTASQTQAMPVVRISQNNLLRLTLPVPESAVPTVAVGQEVEVKVPTLNRTFKGRVARFADKLQTATRTMDTEVDVPNPNGILVPGMYAEVSLTTAHEQSVLTVPVAAVDQDGKQEGKKASLLVVDSNGRLQRAAVDIGMETAERVEISGGVNEGTLVVVGNRSALHTGQQVQPKLTAMTEVGERALMSRFAIRAPYLILVICLMIAVIGITSIVRMPVDMFPSMNIPVVVVATFYSGMPPEQIEGDITSRFERFFTLASGIEHIESRSLPGVSLIRVYFQPGSNADSAVTAISNLAMANLRRLPPGTLPPVVLKFDASSLPVCLVTFKGEGLDETKLRDLAQFNVRNQIASVPGASVPQPFGGKFRQIMVYADPYKLEAHQLSLMDVVRSVNDANLILPSGDVQIGQIDYNLYTNSQLRNVAEISQLPLKMSGMAPVRVADVGEAKDAQQIQTNVVRVDGQRSVYLPVLKQGGDTNTIAVVDGIKNAVKNLFDVPSQLLSSVVFDQSRFVKTAIETLLHEGAIGLFLTSLMILIFLGSMRATVAVFFSIPLSALATFLVLNMGGNSINSMVLGGLALAFSRLIDNSVVVLENIYRHMELGASPAEAAEKGGREVALPVLAATLTTVVVFFPVTFLYGVSKFLFSALALAVGISLFASYVVALTVVPLFCARFIKAPHHHGTVSDEVLLHSDLPRRKQRFGERFNIWFNNRFEGFLHLYDKILIPTMRHPALTLGGFLLVFVVSLAIYPLLGLSFFPRTDAGQFVINLKAPTGTRLAITEGEVAKVENIIRQVVPPSELRMIVSNIGTTPDFSAIYTSNSAMHTAFVQASLQDVHKTGSYEYMARVKERLAHDMPELSVFLQSGGLVDAVLNMGLPAPIDVQVAGTNLEASHGLALKLADEIRKIPGTADVYIPQDIDAPALQLDIDRTRAAELGLSQREVVGNVITALTSNQMIAPSFWVDPKSGQDYMLTVQYPERQVKSLGDLRSIPLRASGSTMPARLDAVSTITRIHSPTELDHYQLRRTMDIYVRPLGEDLSRIANSIDAIVARTTIPAGLKVDLRGMVQGMRSSFKSFGLGLCLAVVLLYLILVAQFKSFVDPFIILLAVPPGITGVLLTLWLTGTTLNVMSLMGVVMLVGIAVSNSILIVEFTRHLRSEGLAVREAALTACRVRLRPVLMTSLATIIGLMPMALKLGEGSESYAPLARAILGGLAVSVALTVLLVPAAYVWIYDKEARA